MGACEQSHALGYWVAREPLEECMQYATGRKPTVRTPKSKETNMIFTSRFGALAARPNFERVASQDDVDRELNELLNDADLEPALDEHVSC